LSGSAGSETRRLVAASPLTEIRGRCSPQSAAGWRLAATRYGVSVSALIQAFGEVLAGDPATVDMAAVIARAQEVTDQRYERE
jgi:hypothetical protein